MAARYAGVVGGDDGGSVANGDESAPSINGAAVYR